MPIRKRPINGRKEDLAFYLYPTDEKPKCIEVSLKNKK
jgi:hypothetical protein